MDIVKEELKKIFKAKIIWTFMALFIIINVINIFITDRMTDEKEYRKVKKEIIELIDGNIDSEKLSYINDELNYIKSLSNNSPRSGKNDIDAFYKKHGYTASHQQVYINIQQSMEYAYNYKENMNDIITKANDNVIFYEKYDNEYDALYNKKIINIYENRGFEKFYDTEGFSKLFKYNFSSILVIMMLLLGIVPVFADEKACGMNSILRTAKRGRFSTIVAKMLSSYSYTLIIIAVFTICDILSFGLRYGLAGASNPIYSVPEYAYSMFTMSIWKYILFLFVIKSVFYLLIASIILLFSSIFSESIKPLVCSVLVIGLLFVINGLITLGKLKFMYQLNPLQLITSSKIFKTYNVIKLFDKPVYSIYIIITICAVLFAVLSVVTILISNKSHLNSNSILKILKISKRS